MQVVVGENINFVLKEPFTYSTASTDGNVNTVATVVSILIVILLASTISSSVATAVFLWRKKRLQAPCDFTEMENRR